MAGLPFQLRKLQAATTGQLNSGYNTASSYYGAQSGYYSSQGYYPRSPSYYPAQGYYPRSSGYYSGSRSYPPARTPPTYHPTLLGRLMERVVGIPARPRAPFGDRLANLAQGVGTVAKTAGEVLEVVDKFGGD
eukprot:evm.model.scf_1948.1 EVM.evm.TU.scf_1948.1   scf_1948:313-970(-)